MARITDNPFLIWQPLEREARILTSNQKGGNQTPIPFTESGNAGYRLKLLTGFAGVSFTSVLFVNSPVLTLLNLKKL